MDVPTNICGALYPKKDSHRGRTIWDNFNTVKSTAGGFFVDNRPLLSGKLRDAMR